MEIGNVSEPVGFVRPSKRVGGADSTSHRGEKETGEQHRATIGSSEKHRNLLIRVGPF
jgi:hypothetical protein